MKTIVTRLLIDHVLPALPRTSASALSAVQCLRRVSPAYRFGGAIQEFRYSSQTLMPNLNASSLEM
jgi:hypothetical protein